MKRRMLALATLAAAMWMALPQEASAFGKKRGSASCETGGGGSYYGGSADCGSPCGPQYTVSYVDQKVTAYKTETETKDVKVKVTKCVDVKEDYKYTVLEPVTIKQKVTVQETKTKVETYKYTVLTPVTTKEKVTVQEMKTKVEPYK